MRDFAPAAPVNQSPSSPQSALKWLWRFFIYLFIYFFALHDFKCLRHSIVCCEKDEIDFDARVEPARARRVQTAVRYSISLQLVNR